MPRFGAKDRRPDALDQPRVGDQVALARPVLGDKRAEIWLVVGHALCDALHGLAAKQVVHRVEVVADGARVGHRVDQRELVSDLGQLGVHFVDAHARHLGGQGLVRSADRVGRVGLHVPGIDVARSAAEQEEDARLLGGHGFAAGVQLVAAPDRSRQAQRKRAQATGDEGLPSVQLESVHGVCFLEHDFLKRVRSAHYGGTPGTEQPGSPCGASQAYEIAGIVRGKPAGSWSRSPARLAAEIMMRAWRRTETANGDCFGWYSGHVGSHRSARVCGCFA